MIYVTLSFLKILFIERYSILSFQIQILFTYICLPMPLCLCAVLHRLPSIYRCLPMPSCSCAVLHRSTFYLQMPHFSFMFMCCASQIYLLFIDAPLCLYVHVLCFIDKPSIYRCPAMPLCSCNVLHRSTFYLQVPCYPFVSMCFIDLPSIYRCLPMPLCSCAVLLTGFTRSTFCDFSMILWPCSSCTWLSAVFSEIDGPLDVLPTGLSTVPTH